MIEKSLEEQLNMKYLDYVDYLKSKYGVVPYSYFRTETCKSKNQKNSRTKDGLVIHHVGENEHILLGESAIAVDLPFKYQQPDMLVYCNYLEHFLLHIKIFKEYANEDKPGLGIGGCVLIAQQINAWNAIPPEIEWQKNCYAIIKDDIYYSYGINKVASYYVMMKYLFDYLLDLDVDEDLIAEYMFKLTNMSSQFWSRYPNISDECSFRASALGRWIDAYYRHDLNAFKNDMNSKQYNRALKYEQTKLHN